MQENLGTMMRVYLDHRTPLECSVAGCKNTGTEGLALSDPRHKGQYIVKVVCSEHHTQLKPPKPASS